MEATGGKINKILKDTNSNFVMDMPFVNDIIHNKDKNLIENEAYIFEEVIQNLNIIFVWRRNMGGGCCCV